MLLLLAISLTVVGTSVLSHPAHVKYDQRQEGKVNVRTDFENFVILVISPSQKGSIPSTLGGGAGGANDLLDFIFTRANAAVRNNNKRKHSKPEAVSGNETEAFIESKTAPYHVDISKSNLAKLHPADEDGNGDKVLVSPKIALLRNKKRRRMSRAYVLSVPGEETVLLLRKNRKLQEKAVEAGTKKEKLSLLGAEFEQCGPGYERDAQGICKSSKNN